MKIPNIPLQLTISQLRSLPSAELLRYASLNLYGAH